MVGQSNNGGKTPSLKSNTNVRNEALPSKARRPDYDPSENWLRVTGKPGTIDRLLCPHLGEALSQLCEAEQWSGASTCLGPVVYVGVFDSSGKPYVRMAMPRSSAADTTVPCCTDNAKALGCEATLNPNAEPGSVEHQNHLVLEHLTRYLGKVQS